MSFCRGDCHSEEPQRRGIRTSWLRIPHFVRNGIHIGGQGAARMNNVRRNPLANGRLPLRAPLLLLIASLVVACAPTSQPTTESTAPAPSAGPKTLIMALQEEPISLVLYGRPAPADEGGTTGARYERYYIFHANLTMYDEAGNVIPAAAVKVPTAQDGDWKLNPDGTME